MKCYAPDIMPSVTELHGGETVLLGEGSQAVEMKALRAAHAVPAVSLRMERRRIRRLYGRHLSDKRAYSVFQRLRHSYTRMLLRPAAAARNRGRG